MKLPNFISYVDLSLLQEDLAEAQAIFSQEGSFLNGSYFVGFSDRPREDFFRTALSKSCLVTLYFITLYFRIGVRVRYPIVRLCAAETR